RDKLVTGVQTCALPISSPIDQAILLQLRARKYGDAKESLDQLAKDGVRTKELITALGLAALLVRPQEAPPEGTAGASAIERAGRSEERRVGKGCRCG